MRSHALVPAAALGVVTVLVATLLLGPSAYPLVGLTDPGALVRLALPLLRLAATAAAAVLLGALVLALVLVRGTDGPPARVRWVARAAAWSWAALAFGCALLSVADVNGGRLDLGPGFFLGLVVRAAPIGWLLTAAGAALVAVWIGEARTWSSGFGAALLAGLALLGPVVTGQAVDGAGHDIGLPATALSVVATTVWLGAVGALVQLGRGGGPDDGSAAADRAVLVARAGAMSTVCAVVAIPSGLLAAAVLVGSPAGLATPYGYLVLLSGVVTAALVGVVLRRRALPGDGRVHAVARLELALLAVVAALSVAMTRTVPPVQFRGVTTPAEAMLGFDLPDPPSVVALVTGWRLDLAFGVLAVVLALVYGRWLRRVEGWPVGRTAAWFGGCALLLIATSSGFGSYAKALFSVHVAEHMLLSVVVPVLLVLGGPVTLARRALPDDGDARDRLEAVLAAPLLRTLTHPAVAALLVVASPFLLYLTPAFSLLHSLSWIQPAITFAFLTFGYLFFWVVIGVDPSPGVRTPHVARLAVLVASMPFHALFGVVLLTAEDPVSQTPSTLLVDGGGGQMMVTDFYARLRLPWAVDLLDDQRLAALLAWGMGDLPLVGVVIILLVQWRRASAAEDRAARDLLASRR